MLKKIKRFLALLLPSLKKLTTTHLFSVVVSACKRHYYRLVDKMEKVDTEAFIWLMVSLFLLFTSGILFLMFLQIYISFI